MNSVINYTDLNLHSKHETQVFEFEGHSIEIQQYMPIEKKLLIITNVLLNSVGTDVNYANGLKIQVYYELEMIMHYSNIIFTDEDKQNLGELYNNLYQSKLIEQIMALIPEEEKNILYNSIIQTVNNMYQYQNSVLGILTSIKENYNTNDFDIENLQEKIKDPESLEVLKQVTGLIG